MVTDRKTPALSGLVYVVVFLLLPVQPILAMEPIQHWTADSGARVYFVPAPELPMVDIHVVFDAGSARDGGHGGLAQLVAGLLDKGAGGLDANQIAAGFEGQGARFSASALRDMASFSLRSLVNPERLEPATELLATVLGSPEFDEAGFERERKRLQVLVREQRAKPQAIAEQAFYRALYRGHPYASVPNGTPESLGALTLQQVKDFYREFYVASNAVVAIVGDVDRAQAERLAQRVTGPLVTGAPPPPLPPVPELERASEQRIPHPSSQVHIWMGEPGITRDDPDYFPLYVGNHILGGGGLVSRLSEEIREKRGLSYSVYSYFLPMARRGPYRMGLQTRGDQLTQALTLLRENLRQFVESGPEPAELEAAVSNITGGHALRISSNRKIVEYLAMIGFYGLPLDYLETFNARIAAVSAEDIRDAFRRRVHPGRMATVIVGGGNGNHPD